MVTGSVHMCFPFFLLCFIFNKQEQKSVIPKTPSELTKIKNIPQNSRPIHGHQKHTQRQYCEYLSVLRDAASCLSSQLWLAAWAFIRGPIDSYCSSAHHNHQYTLQWIEQWKDINCTVVVSVLNQSMVRLSELYYQLKNPNLHSCRACFDPFKITEHDFHVIQISFSLFLNFFMRVIGGINTKSNTKTV